MRKNVFLGGALCLVATMLLLALTLGAPKASAQCSPCPTWWVEYDYIFPPCNVPVNVDVEWDNGQFSHESSTVDGHIIYNAPPPLSKAKNVWVQGVAVPINGGRFWIPYNCGDGANDWYLCVEVRCNPCLEVKIKLEKYNPCPTFSVYFDYIFPPCVDPVTVDITWANGATSQIVGTTDNHTIYPAPPPLTHAIGIKVNGVPVRIDGIPTWVPYTCGGQAPPPNQCLRVDVVLTPCLQIKIHLEPCP